jgi:phosphoglycolate phosphatase-like HAD superfamily hydrolase
MKLILFDIDGTLLSVRHDISQQVVQEVFEKTFGHDERLPRVEFHGKTDRQIFLEICSAIGFERRDAECRFEEMERALIEGWRRHLSRETVRILDGVIELLERLSTIEDLSLGILTGNLRESAHIKLDTHALSDYFSVGAYGSDAIDRNDLPPIALERANALNGTRFAFERTLIVGDSHRDIACARAWGIRSLAVATGALGVDELRRHSPDAVCRTLRDADYIHEFLRADR